MSKIITGDYHLVKNLNSYVILNIIRTKSPISGAEMAKITGMRPSTVMNILKDLEKKGLILNSGTGESTQLGGRRPTLWEICGNYGYIIGIELEVNDIHAVLVDLNSKIIAEKAIQIEKFSSVSDIEHKIIEIVADLLSSKMISRRNILGLGIGISGIVDIINGTIIKTSLLPSSDESILLGKSLKNHFNFPVYFENDANAAALAEKWFRKDMSANHMIFTLVMIDKAVFGVGFGLILNNGLYRGASMFAGETNSFPYNIKKLLVKCCDYHSKTMVIDGLEYDVDELQIHHLLKALDFKNEIAIKFFAEAGKIVGNELATILNLLDPNLIVVGGKISKAKKYFLDSINEIVNQKFANCGERKFSIVESALSGDSVPLGAATIVLRKIFQGPVIENQLN